MLFFAEDDCSRHMSKVLVLEDPEEAHGERAVQCPVSDEAGRV